MFLSFVAHFILIKVISGCIINLLVVVLRLNWHFFNKALTGLNNLIAGKDNILAFHTMKVDVSDYADPFDCHCKDEGEKKEIYCIYIFRIFTFLEAGCRETIQEQIVWEREKKYNEEKKIWEEVKHKQPYAMSLPTMHQSTSGDLGTLDKFISLQLHSCFNLVSVCVCVLPELYVLSTSNALRLQSGYFACVCHSWLIFTYFPSSFLPPTHFANLKHLSSNCITSRERVRGVVVVGWLHAWGEKPSV